MAQSALHGLLAGVAVHAVNLKSFRKAVSSGELPGALNGLYAVFRTAGGTSSRAAGTAAATAALTAVMPQGGAECQEQQSRHNC